MGKLFLHANPDPDQIALKRAEKFRDLSTEEKLKSLFSLIQLSIALNNNKPIKKPQGKGLIITKAPS